MNWISNVVRPKIRSFLNRRDTPENLWIKCPETGQLVFYKDVEANSFVIPGSDYHMRMGATARMKSMFDNETWFDIAVPAVPADPLKLRDERRYSDRLRDARNKTGTTDAVKLGLRENGLAEGKDHVLEPRWAEGQYDRFSAFAREFVDVVAPDLDSNGVLDLRQPKGQGELVEIIRSSEFLRSKFQDPESPDLFLHCLPTMMAEQRGGTMFRIIRIESPSAEAGPSGLSAAS